MLVEAVVRGSRAAHAKWGVSIFAWLGFFAGCAGADFILSWNASIDPNAAGYRLYYGVSSGQYTNSVFVGASTNAAVRSLVPGITYYFAATSYDSLGIEGPFSTETSYTIPVPTSDPPVVPPQSDLAVTELTTMIVANTATAPSQSNALTYQLVNSPSGAIIDANGIINWTPTLAQSPSTNLITTVVTDSGAPPQSATNSFTVIVSGPYDGIDLTDPTQALADLDGDGMSNLAEYALGTDPRNPADGPQGIMSFRTNSGGSQYLTLRFKQRIDTTTIPLQYVPEVSGDGQTWFLDSTHVLGVSRTPLDAQFDCVTVRDLTAASSGVARFIRLRVIEN